MTEIVYVLTNPTMPGLIKIGRTTNLEQRVKSLSSDTGVPLPFEVFYACRVGDANEVERALHNAFGDHRINPKREFSELDPERVYPVLKLVCVEDVTPRSSLVDDPEERAALEKEKIKRELLFAFPTRRCQSEENCVSSGTNRSPQQSPTTKKLCSGTSQRRSQEQHLRLCRSLKTSTGHKSQGQLIGCIKAKHSRTDVKESRVWMTTRTSQ